jgi:hypothetical protein
VVVLHQVGHPQVFMIDLTFRTSAWLEFCIFA